MALMDLKHPRRATFVKQANFAHGRNRSTMAQLLALIPRNTRRRARTRENLNPNKTNYWKRAKKAIWLALKAVKIKSIIRCLGSRNEMVIGCTGNESTYQN